MIKKSFSDDDNIRFEVGDKLPHKNGMLLIDGIAFKNEKTVNLSFFVPPDSIFAAPDKVLAPPAMIEMLAQLCGAQYVFDKGFKNGQLCGYLVGIDHVTFSGPVYVGDKLDLIAWNILEMKDIQRIKGMVYKSDTIVGQCELTLFKFDEWMNLPGFPDTPGRSVAGIPKEFKLWGREKDAVGKGILKSIREIEINNDAEVATSLSLVFEPGFVGFQGHFPGYPVLPAVTAIYAGWLLAEIFENKELDLCSVARAKFAEPIYPLDRVDVILKHINNDMNNDMRNDGERPGFYSAVIKRNGVPAAKYTLGIKPAVKRI